MGGRNGAMVTQGRLAIVFWMAKFGSSYFIYVYRISESLYARVPAMRDSLGRRT